METRWWVVQPKAYSRRWLPCNLRASGHRIDYTMGIEMKKLKASFSVSVDGGFPLSVEEEIEISEDASRKYVAQAIRAVAARLSWMASSDPQCSMFPETTKSFGGPIVEGWPDGNDAA